MAQSTPFFILSRHWQDTDSGIQIRIWLKAEYTVECWSLDAQETVCFVAERHLEQWRAIWKRLLSTPSVRDKTFQTLMGETVVPVYSKQMQDQRKWVKAGKDFGLSVWEDDINPADRYLMERFLFGSLEFIGTKARPVRSEPVFKVLSVDIETSWYLPGKLPDLYSVALVTEDDKRVFVVDPDNKLADVATSGGSESHTEIVPDIQTCLVKTIAFIQDSDPDCIIGWNVVDFDLQILQKHCDQQGLAFAIGRNQSPLIWRQRSDQTDRFFVEIEGRQIVDGPSAFRSAAWSFDDFSLETVSRKLLDRGKKIDHVDNRVNEIERLYRENLDAFAAYNLEDAQLVLDLFQRAGLWQFLIERSHLTGLSIDKAGGSSAAFNTVYMPRLHRRGYVASSVGEQTLQTHSPGGFVMDSKPGIYKHVLVLDFKSLYPSIIQTFLIDPLGLQEGLKAPVEQTVPGFLDARFHREVHILPSLIDQLWKVREQAKAEKNAPMSQSIKILMNSFYGVLGSHLCRFFDPRLASSITMRGHEILQKTRELIESKGFEVIYGDTDSVFVSAGEHQSPQLLGEQLAKELNDWWQGELNSRFALTCFLEIEFETHYEKFVMPTIRGTEKGSKKRYAGWHHVEGEPILTFKGLEAVRSDWTQLAKEFQTKLYRRMFQDEDLADLIIQTVNQLKSGELDEHLVYKRRLRRRVDQYEKQHPPQVQAALLKQQLQPNWRGRNIEYVKTVSGWQPLPFVIAAIDYDHYIEKQLAPIADALLQFFDKRFHDIIADQIALF